MRDGLRSRSGRCARERLPRGRRHGRRPRRPPPHAAAAGTGPSSAAPSTRDGIPRHRPAESCRHAAPSALWPVRTRRPYFLPQLPGLRGGRAGSGGRSVGASRARSGHPSSSSARAPECPGRRVTEACRVPWIDPFGPRRAQPAVPTSTAVEGLSAGSARGRKLLLRQEHWYARQRVELVSDRAVANDRDQRQVHLAGGPLLPYDHLILATGSRNRALPVPGTHLDGVVGMRTRVDTDALASRLRGGVEVVVTGAGFIGLESAAVAAAHRASVHVLDSPTGRWSAPSPGQRRRTSAGRMIDGACGWISVRR